MLCLMRGAGRAAPAAALVLAAMSGLTALGAAAVGNPPRPIGPIDLAPPQSASAVASPSGAGSRPTALTLTLRYPMTCGQPGPGPVLVSLPAAMELPRTLSTSAVHIRGHAAPSVAVHGHLVAVGLPRPPAVICQSITTGTLTIQFMPAAQLRNPARPGTYAVLARVAGRAFSARLAVT